MAIDVARYTNPEINYIASGGFSSVWLVDGNIIKATSDEFTINFYRYLANLNYPKSLPKAESINSSVVESYNLSLSDVYSHAAELSETEILSRPDIYGYLTGELSYNDFSFFKMPHYSEAYKDDNVMHYLYMWMRSCRTEFLDVWRIDSVEKLQKVFDIFKKEVPSKMFNSCALDHLIEFIISYGKNWCLDPCDSNFLIDNNRQIIFADLFFAS